MPNKATATTQVLLTTNDPDKRGDFTFTLSSLKPSELAPSRWPRAMQYAKQNFDRHFAHDLRATHCCSAIQSENSLQYTTFDEANNPILSISLRSNICHRIVKRRTKQRGGLARSLRYLFSLVPITVTR